MSKLLFNNPFVYLRYCCLVLLMMGSACARAQAPDIFNVSPSIAATGTTITITGNNFNAVPTNNVVYFGSTRAVVLGGTTTQLTVQLDTGAVFGPVSVIDTISHLSCYHGGRYLPTFNSSHFYQDTINFRQSSLFLSTNLSIGNGGVLTDPAKGYITVIGDLDGDGRADMVTVARHETPYLGNLVIYRNVSSPGWISSASFAPVGSVFPNGSLPGGNQPTSIKLADIDGDGLLDIVMAQLGASKVAFYRNISNIGNIAFAPLTDISVYPMGVAPYVIGIADFDKDGKPDVAVSCRDSANVLILRNNSTVGNVSFTYSGTYRCGLLPIGLCIGDVDGDGFADVVVADDSSETFSVLKNISASGGIDFAPRVILSAPGKVSDLQLVDIDGDGRLDIAGTVTSTSNMIVYRNVGVIGVIDATTFEPGFNYVTLASPAGIGTGDLNGDGKPDLVVANAGSNKLSIFRNISTAGIPFGAGSFATKMDIAAGTTPLGVNLGDLDGDGYPEIVATNNNGGTISIYRDYPLPIMDTISGPARFCVTGGPVSFTSATVGGIWNVTNRTMASIDSVTGVLTPHFPGKDTVLLYKIEGGDTSTRRWIIRIDSLPVIPAITGPVSHCIGSPIVMSNTVNGGTWATSDASIATIIASGATVTINGVHAGSATISYSIGNTCGTTVVTNVDTIKALPSPGVITGTTAVCGAGQTVILADTATGGVWSSANNAIATVSATGTVGSVALVGNTTISYTLTNGCGSASATLPFVVNVAAVAGTITGANTVCEGATLTLSNAATGGVWSSTLPVVATVNGAGVVSGVSIGTTIISYTVTNACDTAIDTQMVRVYPLPVVGLTTGQNSLCNGTITSTAYNNTVAGTWSTSNTSIATINSSGIAGGVSAGLVIISYTVTSPNGCGSAYDTLLLTVDATPNAGTISGLTGVCVGAAITLTDPAPGGVWASSNTARATVSGGVVHGVATGNAVISYSVNNSCGTATDTQMVVVNPLPNAGTVSGPTNVCAGANITLTTTGASGIWGSSLPSIATVTSGGMVHGVAAGTTILSYTATNGCGTQVDTQMITVLPPAAIGAISGPTAVCQGTDITLTGSITGGTWGTNAPATATVTAGVVSGLSVGNAIISYTISGSCGSVTDTQMVVVTPQPFAGTITGLHRVCTGVNITLSNSTGGGSWSSSDASATVTAGVVHGVSVGAAIISYSVTNSCGTAVDTQLVVVDLTPDAGHISGPTSVCAGSTISLTNTVNTGSWISGGAAATISSGGAVTGVSAGTVIISYSATAGCGTAVDTQMITVLPLPVAGTITGGHIVCTGVNITLGNTTTGGTWSSDAPSVASVVGGVVHGAAQGMAIISYTVSNTCGTIADTQLVTVDLSPDAGTITGVSSTLCEAATLTLGNVTTGGVWSSGNNAIATISGGVVYGVSSGNVIISYSVTNSCGTATDTQMVHVAPLPHAGTLIGSGAVCTGAQITLSPSVAGGTWIASNGHATVIAGVVAGVSVGIDTITYSVNNSCGTDVVTKEVTINQTPTVSVITGLGTVCAGQSITLTDSIAGGVWTTTNTHATVTGGIVAGVSQGADTIIYTISNICGTATARHTVVIDTLPPAGVITGLPSVCVGTNITLTNIIVGGVWTATNSNATVAGGMVTGVLNGTDTILYTTTNVCGSTSAMKSVVVNNTPFVDTIVGAGVVCQGQTIVLTNTVTGGIWTSDSVSVATVDTAGVVTGISGGTATITYAATSVCGTAATTLAVTVNPVPVTGAISGATHICLGGFATLTNTVSGGVWSVSNGAATIAASGVVSGVVPGTDTVSYTVTNSCGHVAATYVIVVDALPDTGVIIGPSAVCIGADILLTDTVNGGVWSSSDPAIATITAGGMVRGVAAGTVVLRYTVTLGCNVLSAHHIVTVNSAPTLTSTLTPSPICDSTLFGYTPSTVTLGASFAWSRVANAGIANAPVSGVGVIAEVLDNITSLPVNVTYTVALIANGCADTQSIVVRVNPTPRLTSAHAEAVCGGIIFDYIPVSPTPGAVFNWTRSAVAGIVPPASSGTGIIHDSVSNTTGSNITVVYVFTITANSCYNVEQLDVILSPGAHMPHIDIKSPSVLCLNTHYQNFGTTLAPYAGEQYTWQATSPAGIWATGAGAQNCLINFTTPGFGWIYLTSTMLSSGCAQRDSFAVLVDGGIADEPSVIYFGGEFVCMPSDEHTYQWGYDDVVTLDSTLLSGETNQNYYEPAPDLAGKYYWVITTRDGCMQKTYYNAPVAVVNVNAGEFNMHVVPNPNNGSFMLQLAAARTEQVHLMMTDMLGRVVKEWDAETNKKVQVNMNVAPGAYLLTAITETGKVTERIVVGE